MKTLESIDDVFELLGQTMESIVLGAAVHDRERLAVSTVNEKRKRVLLLRVETGHADTGRHRDLFLSYFHS